MLSKSQAKAFFIVGTGLCTVAFLGLTVDSFRQMPGRTHAELITPQVAHGKHLWEANNCMGCHTLFGEGAYYAPELTRVIERRGAAFVRAMLTDPEQMYPRQRKMQKYPFSDGDRDDLIAFFTWAGQVDLNGFPPRPSLLPVAVPQGTGSALADTSHRPQMFNQLCVACHAMGGQGGTVGPALDGVGSRRDADYLRRWLHDPPSMKADTKMPKLPLTDGQIDELVAFLSQQKG